MSTSEKYSIFGRQIGYVIVANIATLLLGFISIPILTKGLGTELYGTWSLINTTIALITPFAALSFGASIVRFLSAEQSITKLKDDYYSACTIVFISGILFSLLLFLLADHIAVPIFKSTSAATYIKLGSILVLINSLCSVTLAYFRMRRNIGAFTTFNLAHHLIQVILVVTAVLLGYSLGGVITAHIVSGVLLIIICLFIAFKQLGFHLPTFSNMKAYLKWGIPLTPNAAMLWIISISDRYMVSYFLGVGAAGVYSASYSLGQYAAFALAPLGVVLYPTISKTYDEGKRKETAEYFKYSIKYLMMISIPAAFGLSILAKPLLTILTSPDFISGNSLVPWVAGGAVLNCFFQTSVYIIHLVGKTHITIRFLAVAAILNITLNLILIPRIGMVGAAIATFISYGVLALLTLFVTRRWLKYNLNLPFISKSIASSCIMAVAVWLISPATIPAVTGSISLGILIYFGVLFALKGLSKQEIIFFTNLIRENIRKVLMLK